MTTRALIYKVPCCLFCHTCISSRCPLYYTTPTSIGSCLESDFPSKKVVKTSSGETFHIQLVPIPVSYLSTLTEVNSLPAYGIINRCPIDRIRVASDSAIDTSWFWSASRAYPIDSSTALWVCLKITTDLRWIKPTPGFSLGFR